MKREGITFYMIFDSDPHDSEYVGDHFMFREYMSGFTGSNGILIVALGSAGLWTDGRYFIQAERELSGSGIDLYRMGERGVPKITEYLKVSLKDGDVLAFDGRLLPAKKGMEYKKIADEAGASLRPDVDAAAVVWTDRPPMPADPLIVIKDDVAGESVPSKLERVRKVMAEHKAGAYVLSHLDDIMWLLNIRGGDVACTPVALSYVYMTADDAHLFIRDSIVTDEAKKHFAAAGVNVHEYDEFMTFMKEEIKTAARDSGAIHADDASETNGGADKTGAHTVMLDTGSVSYAIYAMITGAGVKTADVINPTNEMEAVRNETQMKLTRDVYIRDSAVLTRFLFGVKEDMKNGEALDEYTLALKLDDMRSKITGFMELSFDTISAYGPNAAMMHYEATEESHAELKHEGMYLVDSGGQYMGGTTDVTRTIALGPVTDEMKRDFTLVCVGMLRLADAVFLEGCTGRNLDILARGELWKRGVDYKCGTGHGVGYMLGVHTGPQNIRYKFNSDMNEAVLKAGMTVSDEPGVYIEGGYGIRTENILEVIDMYDNSDGHFYGFKHLTKVPIDLDLIDASYMEPRDIERLNRYHEDVYDSLFPYMETDDERQKLMEACRKL